MSPPAFAASDRSRRRGRGRRQVDDPFGTLRRQRHVHLDPGPGRRPHAADDVPAAADHRARAGDGAQEAEGDDGRGGGERGKGSRSGGRMNIEDGDVGVMQVAVALGSVLFFEKERRDIRKE